jgi:WD40 repeat protein
VAWSQDGKYIAYGGRDMLIHIRRWQDPTADVFTYRGHTGQIYTIAWSPDGKYIASAGTDKTVQVWNPLNGKLINSYDHDNNIYAVAWSPDGLFLASGSTDTTTGGSILLKVWDFTSFFAKKTSEPQLTTRGQNIPGVSTIYSLMWSPKKKGHLAWAGSNGVVQVWDNLGNIINPYNGLTRNVYSVAWSSDGKSIAAGGDSMPAGGNSTPILIWSAN